MTSGTFALEDAAIAAARSGADVLLGYFVAPDQQARVTMEHKGLNDLVSVADRESEQAILRSLFAELPESRALAEEGGVLGRGADGRPAECEWPSDWTGIEWIVDPLDGTTNFLQGLPIWSVSIAAREVIAGVPGRLLAGVVIEPVANRLFSCSLGNGTRRDLEPLGPLRQPPLAEAFLATGFPFRAHAAIDLYLDCFREIFLNVRAIRRCGSAALDLAYVAAGIFDGFFEFRLSAWDIAAGALLIQESGGTVSDLDGGGGFLESGNIVGGRDGIHEGVLEILQGRVSEAVLDELVPTGSFG